MCSSSVPWLPLRTIAGATLASPESPPYWLSLRRQTSLRGEMAPGLGQGIWRKTEDPTCSRLMIMQPRYQNDFTSPIISIRFFLNNQQARFYEFLGSTCSVFSMSGFMSSTLSKKHEASWKAILQTGNRSKSDRGPRPGPFLGLVVSIHFFICE